MKTILDAVNTLKGVWPSESIKIIEIDGVEFSEKEFNDCVVGCINDFGLPSVTTKPVYTQTMYEQGYIPQIGAKVILIQDIGFYSAHEDTVFTAEAGEQAEVIGHCCRPDNKYTCITLFIESYGFTTINHDHVKPIDNSTPKEKAVAELMDEQASLIGNIAYMKKSFGIAYDKWVK